PSSTPALPPTADAKAAKIADLISDRSLAASTLHRLLPGRRNLGDQVLDVLRTCASAADLDQVIGKVGRDRLIQRLDLVEGSGKTVAAYVDSVRARDVRPGDWQGFDRYLDQVTGTRARPGNAVTLLNDGPQAFPAMF